MASSKALSANKPSGPLHQALRIALAPFFNPATAAPLPLFAIAYSGGIDSTALLQAASETWRDQARLLAIHIDHGLAAQSAQWASHCQNFAAQVSARFVSRRLTNLRAGQPNLEEAARNARWQALVSLAQQHQANALLTGHHGHDQAETVLLNLLRGTGLAGLGMASHAQRQGLRVVRPWLAIPRPAIHAFAQARQLSWIEDPSNTDIRLRRNAVRHQLWPAVIQTDPRALSSINRLADLAAQTDQAVSWFASQQLNSLLRGPDQLIWPRFSALPAAIQAILWRQWLSQLGIRPPSQAGLQAMLKQLAGPGAYGPRCQHNGWIFSKLRQADWVVITAAPIPTKP